MAIILNIETATDIGSVCISQGLTILSQKEGSGAYVHAKETTLMIEECLENAKLKLMDLDAVAISSGPGSYTSLRIGTSIAKGMCYALDLPLIAIDTLQSIALAASKIAKGDWYLPMIDARRMEVYTARYDENMNCQQQAHALILEETTFAAEIEAKKTLVFAGNGGKKIQKIQNKEHFIFAETLCKAENLVPLANAAFLTKEYVDVAYFEPDYLKPPNITIPKKIL